MAEIAQAIRPKLFITTGTGGGIGKDMALGDVIIAGLARFDCQTQFKSEPWAHASYTASPVPAKAVAAITPALTRVNAARLPGGAGTGPTIWHSRTGAVVTTDFFAFDDSTDHYKLQGLGQVCDMGDAMVGAALSAFPDVRWFSIRNASDPQISNPGNDIRAANHQAGEIYAKYGPFTTAASAIATWAVIDAGRHVSR